MRRLFSLFLRWFGISGWPSWRVSATALLSLWLALVLVTSCGRTPVSDYCLDCSGVLASGGNLSGTD